MVTCNVVVLLNAAAPAKQTWFEWAAATGGRCATRAASLVVVAAAAFRLPWTDNQANK